QTTGGYPKIATVISADLSAVGRRRPGDALCFAAVTVETAEALCRDAERQFVNLVATLEAVPQRNRIDLRSLYGDNLISGVVTGYESAPRSAASGPTNNAPFQRDRGCASSAPSARLATHPGGSNHSLRASFPGGLRHSLRRDHDCTSTDH